MKTKELIEYLGKARGDKLTKADKEIIQRLRVLDEVAELFSHFPAEVDEIKRLLNE